MKKLELRLFNCTLLPFKQFWNLFIAVYKLQILRTSTLICFYYRKERWEDNFKKVFPKGCLLGLLEWPDKWHDKLVKSLSLQKLANKMNGRLQSFFLQNLSLRFF